MVNVAIASAGAITDAPPVASAPRFSRTPGEIRGGPPQRGGHGGDALRDWGFDDAAIARLRALGVGHTE